VGHARPIGQLGNFVITLNNYEIHYSTMETDTINIELNNAMRICLLAIADDKTKCDMDYPNFRKVKVEIIGVNLANIYWNPINVRILEKGLKKTISVLEDVDTMGYDYEPKQQMVEKQVAFIDTWVDVRWLSNYELNK